jgi:hypothetical protein
VSTKRRTASAAAGNRRRNLERRAAGETAVLGSMKDHSLSTDSCIVGLLPVIAQAIDGDERTYQLV